MPDSNLLSLPASLFTPSSSLSPVMSSRYDNGAFIDYLLEQDRMLGRVHVVGLVCGFVLYVSFIMMFAVTAICQRKRQLKSPTLWAVAIALVILSSASITLQGVEAWLAMEKASDPALVYDSPSNQFLPTRTMLLGLTAVLAHSVLVWRTWLAWSRTPRVLVPLVILTAAGIVGSIAVVTYQLKEVFVNSTVPFASQIFRWTAFMYSAILLTAVTVSLLTTGKLCWMYSQSQPAATSKKGMLAIDVLVESGWLYTIGVIFTVITFATNATGAYTIFTYIIPFLAAMAPTLVILNLKPAAIPPKTLIRRPKKYDDGLSLRCAGLSEAGHSTMEGSVEESDWTSTSAVSEHFGSPPFERRGYI